MNSVCCDLLFYEVYEENLASHRERAGKRKNINRRGKCRHLPAIVHQNLLSSYILQLKSIVRSGSVFAL